MVLQSIYCHGSRIDPEARIADNSSSKSGQRIMTNCIKINYWLAFIFTSILLAIPSGEVLADRGQWLMGLSAGTSTLEPDAEGSPFQVDQTGSTGYKFYLGYDLNSKITFETFYSDLGEVTFSNDGFLNYNFYGLGASYYFPENSEGSAIFLKAGVGKINVSGDVPFIQENPAQLYLGVGMEVQFGSGFALRGEYEYYDVDAQMFSLSFNRRFGKVRVKIPKWAKDQGITQDKQLDYPDFTVISSEKSQLRQQDFIPITESKQLPVDTPVVMKSIDQLTDILGVIDGVEFVSGTDQLNGSSTQVLDQLAIEMSRFPGVKFIIIGHTDNVGDEESNKNLSLGQANAVGAYLQLKGVSPEDLSYLGAGELEPIARNTITEGRELNRRIELLLQ